MPPRTHRRAADVLTALAALLLLLTVVTAYVQRAAGDSDQFANRATEALRDDSVRALVADRVTDEVVLAQQSNLIALRPLVQSAVGGVVGSSAFTGAFRAGVADVHGAVFDRSRSTVTLTLADAGTVVAAALETVRPDLARRVAATGRVELVKRDIGSAAATAARAIDAVRVAAWILLVLTALLAAAALRLSPDRRRTTLRLGVGAAGAGVVLLIALSALRGVAVGAVEGAEARAAAGAVWDAFLGDLRTTAWALVGVGAVVAAAAASLLRPAPLGDPLRALGRALAREPQRPTLKVLRGAALVVAGVLLLTARDAVVGAVLSLAGAYVVYEGVAILLRLTAAGEPGGDAEPAGRAGTRSRRRVVVLAGVLVAAVVIGFGSSGATTTPAPAQLTGRCNGHAELCAKRLDEVAFVATHNSMSAPGPGWFSSMQERPIPGQLEDGVRGLLIDTHYADKLANGRYRTVLGGDAEGTKDGPSQEAVDAAMRLRERAGFKGPGTRGMYLCHSFCELGATRLDDTLRQIDEFLVSHPEEVLVVVNQDAVTPEDFVAAVRKAGLEPKVYTGPVEGRLPTLGEMIAGGRRLVLLAENRAGGAPWYRLAYDRATQETPYAFSRPAALTSAAGRTASCAPLRGPAGAPLFLLNHWVTTDPLPLPAHAAIVNARGPLLARIDACRKLRGQMPNLIAVNFYREGDVFEVVDELNGVR